MVFDGQGKAKIEKKIGRRDFTTEIAEEPQRERRRRDYVVRSRNM